MHSPATTTSEPTTNVRELALRLLLDVLFIGCFLAVITLPALLR